MTLTAVNRFIQLFPLWALLVSALALLFDEWWAARQGLIVPMLALVMFSMGLTLGADDFLRVLKAPRPVATGVFLQFLLMPLAAFLIAKILALPADLAAGMVIVGSCAGGTASNVITYLARGDVALSITMTMTSTLLGVVMTPLLCALYLSRTVEVDSLGMFLSILQLVVVPVLAGIGANALTPSLLRRIDKLLPPLAMLLILAIIAIIVALNSAQLAQVGLITVLAVVLHNSCGLVGGFYMSRLMGMDTIRSRTIAIEVGMQNSGLGVTLAMQFYSAGAALPGAIFSIWHNISGSFLAGIWSRNQESTE